MFVIEHTVHYGTKKNEEEKLTLLLQLILSVVSVLFEHEFQHYLPI